MEVGADMFVEAIDKAARFTRPIHSIVRNYGSDVVQPGTSTLFFINKDGWALTCRHVAELLGASEQIGQRRELFRQELTKRAGEKKLKQLKQELQKKYGFVGPVPYEVYNSFIGCIDGELNCRIELHPTLDVALIHFEKGKILCDEFPVFAKDGTGLKQGKLICRLGFPFPEFTNYSYDTATDATQWTQTGRVASPRFPLEGMVTRHLAASDGTVVGFEMSTPGLRGQSGGPAFDSEGRVWGMQSATNHLDLDFDVNVEVLRQGKKTRVRDSAFLHVGHCVHVDVLKAFMRQHSVAFQEG